MNENHESNEFARWRIQHTYPRPLVRERRRINWAWYGAGALVGALVLFAMLYC